MRMYVLLAALAVFSTSVISDTLTVGARIVDPFVVEIGDGGYDGYAFRLLKEMFPGEEIEIVPFQSISDAINETKEGNVDFTIGAFSITEDREEIINFSHSFLDSSPAVAFRSNGSWVDDAIWISKRIGIAAALLISILYIVGFLVNKIDGDSKIKTNSEGAWWALVTFSTVGYGDYVPDTKKGKLIASMWIVISLFLISIFTGYVSSAMTVKRLTEQPKNLNFLVTKSLSTIAGSTSEDFLSDINLRYKTFDSPNLAVKALINGETDAIIYDKRMLDHHLGEMDGFEIHEIPSSVKETYAFIFPQGSELEERVNREMLRVLPSKEWQRIHNNYFNER